VNGADGKVATTAYIAKAAVTENGGESSNKGEATTSDVGEHAHITQGIDISLAHSMLRLGMHNHSVEGGVQGQ